MGVRIYGPHPLTNDEAGEPQCRIATVFPAQKAVVTLPGIHATQRLDFFDLVNEQRASVGLGMLSAAETDALAHDSVDVVREGNVLLIRPEPSQMEAALAADEVLQDIVPKWQIRFLNAHDDRVWAAIKRHGECWRTAPQPASLADMLHLIRASRKAIDRSAVYYYSRATGSHLLTYDAFARMATLDDESLRDQLLEICSYAHEKNRLGNDEVVFFGAPNELKRQMQLAELMSLSADEVRQYYEHLRAAFRARVPAELRISDFADPGWRAQMYRALTVPQGAPTPEEVRLGLSTEFHMHVEWLPGGRIDGGQLKWDSVFGHPASESTEPDCDPNVKGILANLFREYEDLEYINIGRVAERLSSRPRAGGRRGLYIAEIMRRGQPREIVKIIRMQKWDVRERLDEGKDLLQAMLESEEYTEYVLDRWLGCRQLGMDLPARIATSRLAETYLGDQTRYRGIRIWSSYFMRDYVQGVATDKIASARFATEGFALRFGTLLGKAAAANMIVGRCDPSGRVLFDDGDEILIENESRSPARIVVSDHTGAFTDYDTPLTAWADQYVQPVLRRAEYVANLDALASAYVEACVAAFAATQEEYRERRSAFDLLFKHRPREQAGSLGYRWERVLHRLQNTDVGHLRRALLRALEPAARAMA